MDGWQGSWGTFLYAPLFPVGSIFCFLYLYDYISYSTIDVSFCLVALFLIVLYMYVPAKFETGLLFCVCLFA